MSSDEEKLNAVRIGINQVDQDILALLARRAELAEQVAVIKTAADPNAVFYRPEREAQILRRQVELNNTPLPDAAIRAIFKEVISACLALEETMVVAYLGPAGTFTEQATMKQFGHGPEKLPLASIPDIFREVEAGRARYGVVPVENSTEGAVTHTLDLFRDSALVICGEVLLPIHHCLLSTNNNIKSVKRVLAHQQALAQCRRWLDVNMPDAERVAVSSNAEGARLAAADPEDAAIASDAAAELYDIPVQQLHIEDDSSNTTRFLVIGTRSVAPSGKDKTTLLVSARNQPGALHKFLSPLADRGIDMMRIESRPVQGAGWQYCFFIDVDGHCEDPHMVEGLTALKSEVGMYKMLGSYPRADD